MAAPPITERHLPHFHRRAPVKELCRAATTANITISTALNNGDTLDGVTLATNDRVLVKNQTSPAENGIYLVGASPAREYDESTDDPSYGYMVLVLQGTVNAGTLWQNTNTSAPTIGSTALTFAQFSGGTGSGSITASGYTMTTARLLGRTTASTGAIEEITVGSGLSLSAGLLSATGGASDTRPYIDSGTTLHGTYGDDFTGGSLNTGLWTRRTVTSGEETNYASGGGTWMDVDLSSGAASRLYLQTAPAGDFEVILSYAQYISNAATMTGPVIIDSTGAGVCAFFYNSSILFYLGVLSGYAYASFPQTLNFTTGIYSDMAKLWIGLKKSGTNYSVRYSLNGFVWSPYSATSSQSFTVDRIGFGRFFGTPTAHRMSVDRFNVI